jgi:peptide/nickel transport system permease protein
MTQKVEHTMLLSRLYYRVAAMPRPSLSLVLAIIMLLAVATLVFVVPLRTGFDPHAQSLLFSFEPAFESVAHPLGTDALGRDVLDRLSLATRISLVIAVSAVAVSAVIGLCVGLIAGWFRGRAEALLMAVGNVQLAIPVILLMIVLVAAVGASTLLLILLLGLTNWVSYGRVTRAMVVSLREREFVAAVVAAGGGAFYIMRRHLLPNVIPQILVIAAFDLGVVITIESSLSFIGLGIPPPTPSLGLMISEGQRYLQTEPSLTLVPAVVIFLMIGGVQFVSHGLTTGSASQTK